MESNGKGFRWLLVKRKRFVQWPSLKWWHELMGWGGVGWAGQGARRESKVDGRLINRRRWGDEESWAEVLLIIQAPEVD